jgi:hypothetical protein
MLNLQSQRYRHRTRSGRRIGSRSNLTSYCQPLAPADAATPLSLMAETDAMHGPLMRRADTLAGCMEGSDEEAELEEILGLIEAMRPNAGRWAKTRTCREGRVRLFWRVFAGPRYGLQISNDVRRSPRADSLRVTLCARF